MGFGLGGGSGASITDQAKEYFGEADGRIADADMRQRITQLKMDQQVFSATTQKSAAEAKAGIPPGPASSIFKLYGTELNKRRNEVRMSLMGTRSLGWEGDGFKSEELSQTRDWLRSYGNSIEGGTSEVQLNIIAKRVLGLPD